MSEERTEQATPRRREEARQRGEVPRSAELAGAAALLGALLGLRLAWPFVSSQSSGSTLWFLHECSRWQPSVVATAQVLGLAFVYSMRLALPATVGAAVAGLAANLGQSSFVLSTYPLALRWERMSLSRGLSRMLSRQGVFTVIRTLAKLAIIALVTASYLRSRAEEILAVGAAPAHTGTLIWGLLLRVGVAFMVVAVADSTGLRLCRAAKLRPQPRGCLVEFLHADHGHRIHHDEEGHQQGYHIGIGQQPSQPATAIMTIAHRALPSTHLD